MSNVISKLLNLIIEMENIEMENIEKKNNYTNAKGYSIENKISLSELKKFKNAINHQWLNKIKENNPQITDIAIEKGINIQNGPYTISRTGKVEKCTDENSLFFLSVNSFLAIM